MAGGGTTGKLTTPFASNRIVPLAVTVSRAENYEGAVWAAATRPASARTGSVGCVTVSRPGQLQPRSAGETDMITTWRVSTWAATGILVACATTACSSATPIPSPTSSQAAQFRLADAPALLVQCMLSQGTLGRSDSVFSGQSAWLHGESIVITPATATKFIVWYQANRAITVAGKDLTQWSRWAAANDQLPAGVCGTSVSAAALQEQVFAEDSAAGNPWGNDAGQAQAPVSPDVSP